MKLTVQNILTFLLVACMSTLSIAQSLEYDKTFNRSGVWTLGIDGGAAYQQSDVNLLPCWGVGLTLAKNLHHRDGGFLDFDARGRLLYTQTQGLDFERNYNINDGVLNAGSTDYSSPNGPGFIYSNYRNHTGELSIEGVLTFNRLRERTGIVLSAFGGVGIDVYNTQINQRDIDGSLYDYASIDDSTQTRGEICKDLKFLIDDTYGQEPAGASFLNVGIMPSVGLALGYQLTDRFSMGIEHKMTFTMDDVFDGGVVVDEPHLFTGNDKYHYTSVYARWIVDWDKYKRKEKRPRPSPSPSPGPSTGSNNGSSTGSGSTNQPNNCPVITIKRPSSNGTSASQNYSVEAMITNVTSKEQLNFKVNGRKQNFNFDARTGAFASTIKLGEGNNRIELAASNGACEDSEVRSLSYGTTPPPAVKPIITVTNPSKSPYTTTEGRHNVKANIKNVESANNITFTVNGTPNKGFGYDTNTDAFTGKITLRPGANSIVIKAQNNAGSDQENITINYNAPASPKPVVTITKPTKNPYTSTTQTTNVVGVVKNVDSKNNILITIANKATSNYSYNASSGVFSVPVSLSNGNTLVSVKATNAEGSSTESVTIVYNTPASPKPVVKFLTPAKTPYTTTSANQVVKATILNVDSKSQLSLVVNNKPITNFNFNAGTHLLTTTIALNEGNNSVVIKGTNSAGTDSKSVAIKFIPKADGPTVVITQPSKAITTDKNTAIIKATVKNVSASKDVKLSVNGNNQTGFNFNAATGLVIANISLIEGKNNVQVTAMNSVGTDNATVAITYTPPVQNTPRPVVTIKTPAANPATVQTASTPLKATIQNVTAKNQITYTVNGKASTAFVFNASTNTFAATVKLREGNNNVAIKAVNAGGDAQDTRSIIYRPKEVPQVPAPVVTIKTPSRGTTATTYSKADLIAGVTNVSSASQITVTVKGRPFTKFTYANNQVKALVPLVEGKNQIVVSATNAGGSHSDNCVYIYNKLPKPILTRIEPVQNPYTIVDTKDGIKVRIQHLDAQSSISLKVNNQNMSQYNFNSPTEMLTAMVPLNLGNNTITVSATNTAGSASISFVIKRVESQNQQAPTGSGGNTGGGATPIGGGATPIGGSSSPTQPTGPATKPAITVTSPRNNLSLSSTATKTITANITELSNSTGITVLVNGKANRFTFTNGKLTSNVSLREGLNQIVIKATNSKGLTSKNIRIAYTAEAKKPVVIMVNPTKLQSKARKGTTSIKAMVANVTSKDQITYKVNGAPAPINFNPKTKVFTANASLRSGINTVVIIAKTSLGTSTKTLTITK